MPKDLDPAAPDSTPAPAPVPLASADSPILLDEFCRLASAERPQVELLAAFHSHAQRSGLLSATRAAFADHLARFAARPVE